jgi:hypothetical protein
MTIHVGIDPGLSGAIAAISSSCSDSSPRARRPRLSRMPWQRAAAQTTVAPTPIALAICGPVIPRAASRRSSSMSRLTAP